MKKLRLKALSLGAREILSREQLKAVTGGCSADGDCQGGWCDAGVCHAYGSGYGDNGSGSGSGSCREGFTYCNSSCGCQQSCDGIGAC